MKHPSGLCIFGLFALLVMTWAMTTVAADDEQIKEYIRVSQVELIVRATHKDGTPKSGLTDKDFKIFEDNAPVPITSCMEFHRSIGTLDLTPGQSAGKAEPRVILVYFWVWQQNESLNKALDYLFQHIYREGDTVILMLPTSSRVIHKATDIPRIRKEFKEKILEWTQRQEQDLKSLVNYFESQCEDFVPKFRGREGIGAEPVALTFRRVLEEFKGSLEMEWRSFQQLKLEANNRRLSRLANSLKSLKNEKWALVFFQQPVFPAFSPRANLMLRFDNPDYVNQLRDFAHQMLRKMNSPRNIPAQLKEIEEAFIRAEATYQLVKIGSRTKAADQSKHLVMKDVFSDWQWAFERISRATGGRIISDNQVHRALARLSKAEDVYYRITYAPRKNPDDKIRNKRKIEVKVRDKSLKIHHITRVRLSDVDEIKLMDFQCSHSNLNFILSGYSVRMDSGNLKSAIRVWVTAESPQGETMEFERQFDAADPFLEVSMSLKFPRPGSYRIYFTAEDRNTGLSVSRTDRVTVPTAEK